MGIYLLHVAWSLASAILLGDHYLLDETRPYVEIFIRVCVGLSVGFRLAFAGNVAHSVGVSVMYLCVLGVKRWGVMELAECVTHEELDYSRRFGAVFRELNWLLERRMWGVGAAEAAEFSTVLSKVQQDIFHPPEQSVLAFAFAEVCVLVASTLALLVADWLMTTLLTVQLLSKSSQDMEAALLMISGQLCDCFVELTEDFVIICPCQRLSSILLVQDQNHLMGRELFSLASPQTDVEHVSKTMLEGGVDGALPALCNMFFLGLKDTLGSSVRMQVYCARYLSVNGELRFVLAMTEVVGQEKEDGPHFDFPSMDSAGSLDSGGSFHRHEFASEEADNDDDVSPKAALGTKSAETDGVASHYPDDPPPESRFTFDVTVMTPHVITHMKPEMSGEIISLEMLLFAVECEKFTRWLRLVCGSAVLPFTAEFGPAILTPLAKSFGAMWLRVTFPLYKDGDAERDFAGYTVHVEAVHCPFPWHRTGGVAAQQPQGTLNSLLSLGSASSSGALADYASSSSSKSSKRKKRRHRTSSDMRPKGTPAQMKPPGIFEPMPPLYTPVVNFQREDHRDDSDEDSFKV